jgi:phage shock protein PspC (stress-responsive transcriptional regulator)
MEQPRSTRLTRSPNKIIGGVAAGLAEYLDVDPVIVRVLWVVAGIFGAPFGLIAYVVLWVIMPKPVDSDFDPETTTGPTGAGSDIAATGPAGRRNDALLIGGALIAVGLFMLLGEFSWMSWVGWGMAHMLWPLLLIGAGALLLVRRRDA